MKLDVEVLSKEIINPSSPTSDQFPRYQLSFLGRLSPLVYNPLVLFYRSIVSKGDIESNIKIKVIDRLKQSLSDVLTYFCPLASRINDNMFVNCNDEGITFVEARARCEISDVLDNPVPCELNKLLPFILDDADKVPFGVQFNVFDCGGFEIGCHLSRRCSEFDSVTRIRIGKTLPTEDDVSRFRVGKTGLGRVCELEFQENLVVFMDTALEMESRLG
ncbi:hypothetical protein F3Y22_tig00110831pilonHSYRG00091 [Hibiscus syriacus]|uniref:Uncharacterized protein n=1 Tax=Hibiscus syriacus TaxID=106335 RepID=A0A6A2ZKU1_HIBSY|nr:hypothetical protein F3Y22_tig00110831pilonHSYRG00091 [Hibiscus syriacus]